MVYVLCQWKVLYQSEVYLREDVSGKMQQRAMYRRTRRSRKTRYRPARWNNRANSRRDGRLAPSIRSKLESHFREKKFVESILPVTKWKVELASFDIHKITNPDVQVLVIKKEIKRDSITLKPMFLQEIIIPVNIAKVNQKILSYIVTILFSDQKTVRIHLKIL